VSAPLLTVEALGVVVAGAGPARHLLQDVGFTLERGESVALVGPSGAGKSTLGHALLRLLPSGGRFTAGARVRLGDLELGDLDARALRGVRGRRVALVPQEPLLALDPTMRIGAQLVEGIVAHGLGDAASARARTIAALDRVGIPDARRAVDRFPHEFSGGMRQRALIAAALVLEPELLIADEPTTALDPTVQAQVLDLLEQLRAETGSALLLISHDLDVVGERCTRTLVLDGGRVVEEGATAELLRAPRSGAGQALAAARRRVRAGAAPVPTRTGAAPLLDATSVTVEYAARRLPGRSADSSWRAVSDVSLQLARGEAMGLIGESGCGKSSLARALLRLGPLTSGTVRFDGRDLATLDAEALRRLRRRLQLVPQDAGASLTPHLTAGALVREGLEVHGLATGADASRRAEALLEHLGLPSRAAATRADELSSGERQRVAIARALAVEPDLLVCDEPVASVDAVTRLALLDLLADLRREHGLALLVISHDLDAVRRLADTVAVMYLGRVVERGPVALLHGASRMPYTQALIAAEPTGDAADRARRLRIQGEVSPDTATARGCPFHGRCHHPAKDQACAAEPPALRALAPGHEVACWKA
jgi:peptide/nickel transport system ATP-binding protein